MIVFGSVKKETDTDWPTAKATNLCEEGSLLPTHTNMREILDHWAKQQDFSHFSHDGRAQHESESKQVGIEQQCYAWRRHRRVEMPLVGELKAVESVLGKGLLAGWVADSDACDSFLSSRSSKLTFL